MLRGRGRTPNPYHQDLHVYREYGKYAEYFDARTDTMAKYTNTKYDMHLRFLTFGYSNLFSGQAFIQDRIARDSFVAPSATIAGQVELWNHASVWYGAVIKGDTKVVRIGFFSNIQDDCVIEEETDPLGPDHDGSCVIGHYVTVGHNCHIKAATVEDNCLIGSGSVLEPGSYMERDSQLGACSVLPANTRVPSRQLWAGNPAKYIRDLTTIELNTIKEQAITYHRLANAHKDEFYLDSNLHQLAEKEGLSDLLVERPYV